MSMTEQLGEIKEVTLEQGTIRYRESGSGRPIVFVHGFMANGDLWGGVAPELAGEHRCIVPDWPMGSHELAMPAETDLRPPAMARLVADFIAALNLTDVVLVGNDSGGAICQIVVTEHPERIGALVLTPCDGYDKFPPFPYDVLLAVGRVPGLRAGYFQSLRFKLSRRIGFGPLMAQGYDDHVVRSWTEPSRVDLDIRRDALKFASGMSSKVTMAAYEKLPDLKIPALLVWGPDCRFFTIKLARKLADAIPDSQIVELPNTQTFLSMDEPVLLAGAIEEFVVGRAAGASVDGLLASA